MEEPKATNQNIVANVRRANKLLLRIGIFLGIGIVGTLDETIFHQLLQWHTFYVHADQYWRIFSDGLFHIVSTGLLLIGVWQLWVRRQLLSKAGRVRALIAGILFGMGGFNLYDGIIQHKILNLHPVREGVVDLLPYDIAWNAVSIVILIGGWLVWRGVRSRQFEKERPENPERVSDSK